jgi:hydrogenase maturation protease
MTSQSGRKPILVLGIGNILLSDEGIGVRVIEHMQTMTLREDVQLVDGGTSGMDLLDVLADREKVIVVDAIDADCTPGTVLRFGLDQLMQKEHADISLHELGIAETVNMTRQLGCAPKEVIVFGIQPQNIDCGLELSQNIQHIVRQVAELILAELNIEPEKSPFCKCRKKRSGCKSRHA